MLLLLSTPSNLHFSLARGTRNFCWNSCICLEFSKFAKIYFSKITWLTMQVNVLAWAPRFELSFFNGSRKLLVVSRDPYQTGVDGLRSKMKWLTARPEQGFFNTSAASVLKWGDLSIIYLFILFKKRSC